MAPLPSISARVADAPGAILMLGETFHPCPRSRAASAPVPSVAMPPPPLAPLKFSGLIERVCALEIRARFPRCMPRPLNAATLLLQSHVSGLVLHSCRSRVIVAATERRRADLSSLRYAR